MRKFIITIGVLATLISMMAFSCIKEKPSNPPVTISSTFSPSLQISTTISIPSQNASLTAPPVASIPAIATNPPLSSSPEMTTTVSISSISQVHLLYGNEAVKQNYDTIVMAINDTLAITVNGPSLQEPNAYISDDNVIKQTGRIQGPLAHPPGQGLIWLFIFQAMTEGTSSISIGPSPETANLTIPVAVIKTFFTSNTPKYNVTFKLKPPAPSAVWTVTVGDQQSPSTDASSITFVGIPDGLYNYSFEYSLPSGSNHATSFFTINGANKEVMVPYVNP
jgi:hypothetical protein